MKICGIDEAGRGPVIGPMVMAGAMTDEKGIQKLQELGVKDSKLLSPRQRERLFPKISEICSLKIVVIQPREIDEAVSSPTSNLNKLELIHTAVIINDLEPHQAIVDCPSTNTKSYAEELRLFLKNKKIEIIAEHKADLHFPIVSAASIIAKVTRDNEIEKIKKRIGIEFGSAYPSDERTVQFLKKHWREYPDIIRKTWATYKNLQDGEHKKKLDLF